MIAGTVSGCITRSCTSPLDVVKIIVQVNGKDGHVRAATTAVPQTYPSSYELHCTPKSPFGAKGMSSEMSLPPNGGISSSLTPHKIVSKIKTMPSQMSSFSIKDRFLSSHMSRPSTRKMSFGLGVSTNVNSKLHQLPRSYHSRSLGRSSLVYQVSHQLYSQEGLRGFWKGNLAGCCRLGPYAGLKFCFFDMLQSRQHWLSNDKLNCNVQRAINGAGAGMIATLACYPMEVLRTRLILQQASEKQINGLVQGIRHIVKTEGVRGLYKGGISGLVGAIPFEGAQFACYEFLKSFVKEKQWSHVYQWKHCLSTEFDALDYLIFGSISGAVAQTIAYPFDSVKKRLQSPNGKTYRGMCDCFQQVIRTEGVGALYRGTLPNMARVVPYAAVMFSSYENVKKLLCWLNA